MEFAQGGELFNLLQIVKQFAENTTRYYAAQIILALEALHEQDIIYRDLKPENVLLDDKGYIKLADFGMSKKGVKGKNDAKSVCGTPEYLAPEILTKQGYGKAVDYWALGSIIYEMLTGFPPFYIPQDQQNKQYDEGQARNDLFMRILNEDLRYPPHLTKLCINFLQGLLQKDPNKRLGAKNGIQEIKNHPWFNQLDWNILINKQYQAPYKPVIKEDDYINLNEQQQYTQTPLDDSLQTASLQSQTDPINFNNFTYSGTQIDENNMDIEG
ncbi:Protein kinase-like domain [Pseudocohnilembus persalinus]|uniref:Protein kinase-like domain n=1 Tax=Pseudocohnilembus persalinus TaxID=266149 RepID=A0A0V0QG86_PSEPJ|nr:Protein kinase-like domain [Pseudocohnilembus persalinus]|eukprot:KRX01061.1 Protein kinase-like domain [Pseudocohnilembus persalinus]